MAREGKRKYNQASAASAALTGWNTPGKMDELVQRWSSLPALPIEGMMAQDAEGVRTLRTAVLKRQGLAQAPTGWAGYYYSDRCMITYLRSRPTIEKAAQRAVACMKAADEHLQRAMRHETIEAGVKELQDSWHPILQFGKDKRGCSMCFLQLSVDLAGLSRETSPSLLADWLAYNDYLFWDLMFCDSIAAGQHFYGRNVVVDVADVDLARVMRNIPILAKINKEHPDKEHCMPEALKDILCCNCPWWIEKPWALVQPLLPPRDRARVKLFTCSQQDPNRLPNPYPYPCS